MFYCTLAATETEDSSLLWGVLLLAAILLFVFFYKTTKGRGLRGELLVRSRLKRYFGSRAMILNNFIYVDPDYHNPASPNDIKSVQIDHIVVCEKGVLVIETKNYSGRLYGESSQQEWTQVLAGGRVRYKHYNPIKQNATHCHYVKKIVGNDIPVRSIIVLVKNNTSFLSCPDFVVGLSGLYDYLSSLPNLIDEKQALCAFQKLNEEQENCTISPHQHNKHTQSHRGLNYENVCPCCGGRLVRRKGPFGSFLGCENYPKCKFKKY